MGPEIALLMAAAGTAASMAGERNAAKERRGILNRQMERTAQEQQRTAADVLQEGQQLSGQARADAIAGEERSAIARAMQDVGGTADTGAGAATIDTAGGQGAVSADFLKAKADRALSEGERMTAVARELAKLRAPGSLMQREGIRRAGTMSEIASRAGSNRAMARASEIDASNVDTPWWGKLGKIAQQVGMMAATGGMGGPGAGAGAGGTMSTLNTATPRITMFA